jgi:hypothetical protein
MTKEERDIIKQELHEELANRSGGGVLNRAAIWLGLAVSVLTLCAFLWRGGALANTVERVVIDQSSMMVKVQALEVSATSKAREYMAEDTQRSVAIEARVKRLEDAMMNISSMQADIAVIKNQVQESLSAIRLHIGQKP